MGLNAANGHLVTQGSDNVCKVWTYPEIELKFQLEYDCLNENFQPVRKPFIGSVISLAGCFSGANGQPCLTILNPKLWQVIEVLLPSANITAEGHKRRSSGETHSEVTCTLQYKTTIIIGTPNKIVFLDLNTLSTKLEYPVESPVCVRCI